MSKSKKDVDYERGFRAGKAEAVKQLETLEVLRERLNYLRLGGSWQVDSAHESTTGIYLAGFEDAMRTLEVKP